MNYEYFLRDELSACLSQITPDTEVLWGKMSPQNIVEHLGLLFMISNGKIRVPANAEPDRLAYRKMRFFAADVPFPRGFRNSFIPEDAPPPKFLNLEEAIQKLTKEQQRYFEYFAENPDAQEMHPVLGPLDFKEWNEFHVRHIKHHLAQLGQDF